jgi:hypothetical protein
MAKKVIEPGPKKTAGAIKREYRVDKSTGKKTEVMPASAQKTVGAFKKEYRVDKLTGKKTEVKK